MNGKRKAVVAVIAVLIAVIGIITAVTIHNAKSDKPALEDITLSNSVLPSHPLSMQDGEELTLPDGTVTAPADISEIKDCWWYLYNDEKTQCYAFCFGDNDRADLVYLDSGVLQGEDYESGYSVYNQQGDSIVLKHLPDGFPIKEFTLKVSGGKIYCGDTELIKGDLPSKENFIKRYKK